MASYLGDLALGLRQAAGVLNPDVQKETFAADNQRQQAIDQLALHSFLAQQQAQINAATPQGQLAQQQVELAKVKVKKDADTQAYLADPATQRLLSAGTPEALDTVNRGMVAKGLMSPMDYAKERQAAMKPQPIGAGGLAIPDSSGGYTTLSPAVKQQSPGTVRKIQVGDQEVTQEAQADGTWKQIGIGPKFARQVAPVVQTGDHAKYSNVQPDGQGGFVGLNKTTGTMEKIPQGAGVQVGSQLEGPALDAAAARYRLDGTLPTNLGRGNQGSANTIKILNKASEQASAIGDTAEEQRIRQIAGKAATSALTDITKRETQVGAFEKTFTANMQKVEEFSNKIDRDTNTPLLDKWIQSGKRVGPGGNPDLRALDVYIQGVTSEFGKIVSGSMGNAQVAEGVIRDANSRLTAAMTKPEVIAALNAMKVETGNRMKGFADQKAELQASLKSSPKSSATRTTTGGATVSNW